MDGKNLITSTQLIYHFLTFVGYFHKNKYTAKKEGASKKIVKHQERITRLVVVTEVYECEDVHSLLKESHGRT